jgi:hypothetical protein
MSNDRGHYDDPRSYVGAEAPRGRSNVPWLLSGVGLVAVGLAVFGAYVKRSHPRLSAHEKEVRAWETEFPGLPWYMDRVKDARQLDLWERARDHWERTR